VPQSILLQRVSDQKTNSFFLIIRGDRENACSAHSECALVFATAEFIALAHLIENTSSRVSSPAMGFIGESRSLRELRGNSSKLSLAIILCVLIAYFTALLMLFGKNVLKGNTRSQGKKILIS